MEIIYRAFEEAEMKEKSKYHKHRVVMFGFLELVDTQFLQLNKFTVDAYAICSLAGAEILQPV